MEPSTYTKSGDLGKRIGLDQDFLEVVLNKEGVESYYREFTIAKKSGGRRSIAAPTGHLLRIQRRIADYLQDHHTPRPSAHGFVRGRSIATNAHGHIRKDFVLNLDLRDFFPTIHFGRVLGLLESEQFGFGHDAALAAAKFVCYEGRLPIGGPASPILANMVCTRLDGEMQRLASHRGAFYTRYADDMTFSWNDIEAGEPLARFTSTGGVAVSRDLVEIVESNTFEINETKTRLMFRTQSQRVTGLVVNEKVNVSRRTIRLLRAMIHSIERDGLEEAQRRFDVSDTRDRYFEGRDIRDHLDGWLNYLSMIRGSDDRVTARLRSQLDNVLAGRSRGVGAERLESRST